ncbi:type VI secretion system tip protein TssI/VgrG [Polyangium sp. y55x31]|uniref:type VI secretion system Vgr family protein n=1 Tax=Polyangium sp. y55x31 TaxID=3042688 RepID=UPI002482D56D|nr:type VI secretion system tip protein TssI/VgrG [Polyangium sp. y55x31]MDI1476530.1 type VI secretion system tip protein TssI/VgrG [Polyangium sp. y55x31]
MTEDKRLEGVELSFVSGGLDDRTVELHGVWGKERLSRLFEFELLLASPEGPLTDDELDSLLRTPCAISMGPKDGDVVHGILERIEMLDAARGVAARYIARMVPSVWLLTLGASNRVFQDVNVPELVEAVLVEYGLTKGEDFDILVSGKSPKREYIVQYEESDWDFVQRWLEHEGFFYWFEHGEEGEKLIIADANEDATPIEDPRKLSYRERNNLSTGGLPTIWDWGLVQRRIPARMAVVDYNYRTPAVTLAAKVDIDTNRGFGSVFSYGEHFKTVAEGKAIAKLRAERILAERRTYSARTDCARFRVGHTFELLDHHDDANDGKYLVTSIEHRVGYPVRANEEEQPKAKTRYVAHFEAIPLDVPFRPERVTPWPSIHGVLHAHIAADTEGETAQIDDQGRYRVRLPFDASGRRGTKASRWIRMAQPYSGSGYGTHFPLHKGAEVLIAHVDGDPDRPIIMGSVPNPHTLSPSTSSNATQSVIQTHSGIRVEMEDRQG